MGKLITDKVSGLHGVVVIPDSTTCAEVIRLGKQSPGMSFRTEQPHVSLYHVDLDAAPVTEIETVLDRVQNQLRTVQLQFDRLSVFGNRFAFWDLVVNDKLRDAHDSALMLSRFRKASGASSVENLGLDLTTEQIRNDEIYGYVFVQDSFRPHATIGYYDHDVEVLEIETVSHVGSVASVGLYRLGDQGRILNEVARPLYDVGR